METEVNESALTSSKRGNDHLLQQTVAQQDIDPYLPVFLEKPKISIFVGNFQYSNVINSFYFCVCVIYYRSTLFRANHIGEGQIWPIC